MDQIIEKLVKDPLEIFNVDGNSFNQLTKSLLDDYTKYSPLDEIYIDGLDSNQVYGQAKLVLDNLGEYLLSTAIPKVRELVGDDLEESGDDSDKESGDDIEAQFEDEGALESEGAFDDHSEVEGENFSSFESDAETKLNLDSEDDNDLSDAETKHLDSESDPKPVKDAFGLNDQFFDIDEYNKQIVALEDEPFDEDIDFFAELSSDEEENMAYYDEFFDKPGDHLKNESKEKDIIKKSKKNRKEEEEEEIEDFNEKDYDNAVGNAMLDLFEEEDTSKKEENLSTFEKTQLKLRKEIEKLESELVADKKWTMKGEISSKDRPHDSLLDDQDTNNLDFERTSKPVPTITDEVTESIEDLIRRRIKANEFDDLLKRFINDITKFHNKNKYELSEQKSSKSLSEIYEDQYNQTEDTEKIDEELKKKHDEIDDLFTKVNHKLDSLCSAHFIPKPHQFKTIEIKVNDNAASINMEDSQPLHVSSESTLAPQEIYKIGDEKVKSNGVLGRSEVQLKSGLSYSKDELSRDDKQRLRRANKRKKSKDFNNRKSIQLQRQTHQEKTQPANPNKRQKVGSVIDTLSKAKNVTVIDKKGQLRDTKGNVKKDNGPKGSSSLRL